MFSLEQLNSMLRGRCTEEELEEYLLADARNIYCKDPLNEAWERVGLKGNMQRIAIQLQNFCNGTPERYGFLGNRNGALCDRLRCTRFANPAIENADIGAEKLLMDYIVCVVRDESPLQNGLCEMSQSGTQRTSTEYLALLSVVMIRKTSLTWFEQEVRPLKRKVLVSYQRRHPDAGRVDSRWYLPKPTEGWQADTDYIQDIGRNDLPSVLGNLPNESKIKPICTDPDVAKLLLCGQTPNINDPVKALEVYLKENLEFVLDEQNTFDQQVQTLAACMEKNWKNLFADLCQPKPKKASKGAKLPQRGLQMVLRLLLGASTGMMGGEAAQRNSIIRAAFAIDGNVETLDRLLYSFDLAGIDYKDANEQIFAYAISQGRDFNFASLMAKVYSLMCENEWGDTGGEQPEWRPTQYWKRDSVEKYKDADPKGFLTYLLEKGFRTGKRNIPRMHHVFTSREYYTLRRFNSLKLCVMKEEYDKLCEMSKTVQDGLKALNMGRVEESQKNDYLMWRDATLADESTIYGRIKKEITDVAFCCFNPKNDYQQESLREEISLLIGQLKKGDLLTRSQFFLLSLCEHKVRKAPYNEFLENLRRDLNNSRYEPVDEMFEKELLDKAREMLGKELEER